MFETVADVALGEAMSVKIRLGSDCDILGTMPTRSATPTTAFEPFLISAMRPRTAVLRERISQVFDPDRIMPIHG